MREELIVTEEDLQTSLQGECDLVTLTPYRVGDHLLRCRNCRALIKAEFVTEQCPLCGCRPFRQLPKLPAILRHRERFLPLLLLAVFLNVLAVQLAPLYGLIEKLTWFSVSRLGVTLLAGIIGIAAALLLYWKGCRAWETADYGGWLLLAPAAAPYGILAALHLVIALVALVLSVLAIAVVLCFLFRS